MDFKPLQFAGGAYADETMPWSQQDTVNYLPVQAEKGGTASPAMLKTVPGMSLFATVGTGPIRGMRNVEGRWLVVSGTSLYWVKPDGTSVSIGTIPGVGRVDMAHNQITGGNQVLIATGTGGYVYNTVTGTLAPIVNDSYPGATCVRFLGQYLVQIEPQRRFFFHSDLADATAYSTLDQYEAEAQPDLLMCLEVSQGDLLVFGERTTEVWRNEVTENAAFQKAGVTIERGIASQFASAVIDNSVIFLGDDGVVYRLNGYSPTRISTFALEQAIAHCDLRRAFAFSWEARGHKVFYLTFQDGRTWGYDVASGEWHRRKSFGMDRWRINALINTGSFWLAGDMTSGNLYKLDWGFMGEGDYPLERERTFPVLFDSFRKVRINAVSLLVDTGNYPMLDNGTRGTVTSTSGYTLTVAGTPHNGVLGAVYSPVTTYTASGGHAPYAWNASGLPTGMTIAGGVLSGTPASGGSFSVRVTATDRYGVTGSDTDIITIDPNVWFVAGTNATNKSLTTKSDVTATTWGTTSPVTGMGTKPKYWASYTGGNIYLTNYDSPDAFVVKSADRGVTWTDISASASSGINGRQVLDSNGYLLLCSGQNAIQRRDKVTGVWSSVGGATSWASSIIKVGSTLYVAQHNNTKMAKSTDDGATWTFTAGTYSIDANSVGPILATNGTRIVMMRQTGTGTGDIARLSHTDDGGATWTDDYAFPVVDQVVSDLAYSNGKWVAITQAGSTAISTDGVNWTAGGTVGATSGGFRAQLAAGNGVFMYVDYSTSNIKRSTDGGATWSNVTGLPTFGSEIRGLCYIGA